MPGAGRPTDYSSRTPQRTVSHYFGGSPSFASVGRAPSGARSLTSARCLKRALSHSLSRRTELRRTGLPRRTDLRRTGLPHADLCRPYLRLPFLWWVSLSLSPAGPNSVGPVFPAGPISVGPAFLIPISVGIGCEREPRAASPPRPSGIRRGGRRGRRHHCRAPGPG